MHSAITTSLNRAHMWIYFQQPTMITEPSHTHSVYLERGGTILICATATVSHTLACFSLASCPVGLSQPPIKILLHNPSLSVTLLHMLSCETMWVLLPSPGFTSLICLCDKYSVTLSTASRVHIQHTDTHCGIQFPVCHTRQHVCFYLNHILPLRI